MNRRFYDIVAFLAIVGGVMFVLYLMVVRHSKKPDLPPDSNMLFSSSRPINQLFIGVLEDDEVTDFTLYSVDGSAGSKELELFQKLGKGQRLCVNMWSDFSNGALYSQTNVYRDWSKKKVKTTFTPRWKVTFYHPIGKIYRFHKPNVDFEHCLEVTIK